MNLCRI